MEGQENKEIAKPDLFPVVVDERTAIKEVTDWLDAKRVKPTTRIARMGNIGVLVEAVMYGNLKIDPATWTITHTLDFPILDEKGVVYKDKLEYKYRLTIGQIESMGVSEKEATIAKEYGAALSGLPLAIMGKLDSNDLRILTAVGVFFT